MLAHGYDHRYIREEDRNGNHLVKAAYDNAESGGKFDKVLRFDGEHVRHPALLSSDVFFAEMTESYYGFNDHYPFIQFELSRDAPGLCDLLAEIWGGKAK